ncbi:MAG: dTDP-4-dehydrorhamnose 3,5-epimerase [Candidatus Eremiobacteraeota bacterium]|nr:dTDP-4-dehydrorhamnose 3,5-epimerase [Candidatus Eremiobacteraeota bacterium]
MLEVRETSFAEVKIIVPEVFNDARGSFEEVFSRPKYAAIGILDEFIQDNVSRSRKNVLRGMHYDLRMAKLVQTLHGAIYDVVVDMREDSKFYKKWFGCRLTAENHWQLYVPAGFAHGFVTLSDEALVMYKQSATYAPEQERLLRWDDPTVAIEWPPGAATAVLSAKDAAGP